MTRAAYVTGKRFRAGRRGVVITWRDFTTTTYAARALVVLEREPLKVEGRLYPITRHGAPAYEAPALRRQP